MKLKGLRVTPVWGQAQEPAPWFRKDRPCAHCQGRILYRTEHTTVTTVTVQHPAKCLVLKGSKTNEQS